LEVVEADKHDNQRHLVPSFDETCVDSAAFLCLFLKVYLMKSNHMAKTNVPQHDVREKSLGNASGFD